MVPCFAPLSPLLLGTLSSVFQQWCCSAEPDVIPTSPLP